MGLKICAERCGQCLFSKDRIVSKARMVQIVRDCRRQDAYFNCHTHDEVMCRGWHETQPPSQMERIAGRLGMIEYVPQKDPA